jgi:hypothetical protein
MGKYFSFIRSRLKMALLSDIFLAVVTVWAIEHSMSGTASAAIAGILSITSMYIYAEGKRPSKNV